MVNVIIGSGKPSPSYNNGSEDDNEVIKVSVRLSRDELQGFSRLAVYKSPLEGGPYEEITAAVDKPARLPADASEVENPSQGNIPVGWGGLSLRVTIGVTEEVFVFSSSLTTLNEVVGYVNGRSNAVRAYVDENGRFVLSTIKLGTGAMLVVNSGGSAAAASLGLPVGVPAFGKTARPVLVEDMSVYEVVDYNGSRKSYYKTQLIDPATGAKSGFSRPYSATTVYHLDAKHMVKGKVYLVDLVGRPIQSRQVIISAIFTGNAIDGRVIAGGNILGETDHNGYVEFFLVRGQPIKVSVVGTDLVREVVPPTDPALEEFDLLDPAYGLEEDYFKVKVPKAVAAERRNF